MKGFAMSFVSNVVAGEIDVYSMVEFIKLKLPLGYMLTIDFWQYKNPDSEGFIPNALCFFIHYASCKGSYNADIPFESIDPEFAEKLEAYDKEFKDKRFTDRMAVLSDLYCELEEDEYVIRKGDCELGFNLQCEDDTITFNLSLFRRREDNTICEDSYLSTSFSHKVNVEDIRNDIFDKESLDFFLSNLEKTLREWGIFYAPLTSLFFFTSMFFQLIEPKNTEE